MSTFLYFRNNSQTTFPDHRVEFSSLNLTEDWPVDETEIFLLIHKKKNINLPES